MAALVILCLLNIHNKSWVQKAPLHKIQLMELGKWIGFLLKLVGKNRPVSGCRVFGSVSSTLPFVPQGLGHGQHPSDQHHHHAAARDRREHPSPRECR